MKPRAAALCLFLVSCGSSRSVDPEQIRRACVFMVSCFPSLPGTTVSNCVSSMERSLLRDVGYVGQPVNDFRRWMACGAKATSCNDMLNCSSGGHDATWCNAHPGGACDADVFYSCVSGWGLVQADCAAYGMHCVQLTAGSASCTTKVACTAGSPARCDGTHAVSCDPATSQEISTDCTAIFPGGICASGYCNAPPSPLCTGDQTSTCDGNTLILCEAGGADRADCLQIDSRCVVDTTFPQAACLPIATACTDTMPDTCVGNSLQACVNGVVKLTDCTVIGFAGCQNGKCM